MLGAGMQVSSGVLRVLGSVGVEHVSDLVGRPLGNGTSNACQTRTAAPGCGVCLFIDMCLFACVYLLCCV